MVVAVVVRLQAHALRLGSFAEERKIKQLTFAKVLVVLVIQGGAITRHYLGVIAIAVLPVLCS